MSERIDNLQYVKTPPAVLPTTVEGQATTLFLTSPAEFLCEQCALKLRSVPNWRAIFGDSIDAYCRMDYSQRALPALRIYNKVYDKQFESWWVEGDLVLDVIFPASIRRRETQQYADTVAGALLQQFRRVDFFNAMSAVVPAINELGKKFRVNKSLAFEFSEENLVPMTQILVNFKIDLRIWDTYLESDYRTKDDPFERTLANLAKIATTIIAVDDDGDVDISLAGPEVPID
jgi:hypothetical protein